MAVSDRRTTHDKRPISHNSIIEDIKSRIDIVELIGEDTQLRSNGQEYIGWHRAHDSQSKTSLHVSQSKQLYLCHNCGEGGDIFSWLMYNNGMTFPDAMRHLAQRAGISLPDMTEEQRVRCQQIYDDRRVLRPILAAAAKFYHTQLEPCHSEDMTTRWGLTPATVAKFIIGYSPRSGSALLTHLKGLGYSLDLLAKSGLFWEGKGGGLSDFFRGRIVIPYWHNGTVVYFSGRWFLGCPDDPTKSKYKKLLVYNDDHPWVSPAIGNDYFYGEDSAHNAQELIITEGIADCLMVLQNGYACVSPGTVRFRQSDTDKIIRLAKKVKSIYICNDQEDSAAGEAGALDTAALLSEHGIAAKLMTLPRKPDDSKIDLAEFLRDQGENSRTALRELIDTAQSHWDIKISRLVVPADGMDAVKMAREFAVNQLALCDDMEARRLIKGRLRDKFNLDNLEVSQIIKLRQDAKYKVIASGRSSYKLPPIYDEWVDMLDQTGTYKVIWPGELCFMKETQDSMVPIRVANFIPRAIAEVTRDDGREQIRTLKIDGILAHGIPLPPIMVTAKDFGAMNWITASWGWRPALEPGRGAADRVRHAINLLADNAQYQTIYTYLGWRKVDGKWLYLHGNGAVGNDEVQVDPGDELSRYALPDTSDPQAMLYSLRLLDVAPRSVTIPLFALIFLAPLCEPLRMAGYEPGFVFWLYGRSGNMKSTLAALFLSHFGSFDGKSLPCSFKDTENSLEKTGFLAKDTVLVVDDYHPVGDRVEAQKMKTKAQALLRGYGDRKGRGRMKADTGLRKAFIPRGLCLVTGEDLPEAGESTSARLLKVDLARGAIYKDSLSDCQADAYKLSESMRGYLEWLSPQLDNLAKSLGTGFVVYRNRVDVVGTHARLADEVAWLLIGFQAGLDYAVAVNVLTDKKRQSLMVEAKKVILGLIENQGRIIAQESPSARFLDLLRDIIASGKGQVVDLSTVSPLEDDQSSNRPLGFLGWRDARYYYLLPEVTYQAVAQMAQQQQGNFPVTSQTLWKRLDEDGFIMPGGSGPSKQPTRQKKIGGKNQRLIWLHIAALGVEDDV